MGKQEFLEHLRAALNGRMSAQIVDDNIRYYEDYINIEIRKGRSEAEVLAQLGDPRLIAKTIIQTHGGSAKSGRAADVNGDARGWSQRSEETYDEEEGGPGQGSFRKHMPGGLFGIVALVVFAVALVLILGVVYSVASLAFPILLIILAVAFVVKLFRDWLN